MLTRQQIKAHYRTPGIRDTIMRVSTDGGSYRAGNWDFINWYKYPNGKKLKLCLANRIDYTNMIMKCRTLYWTLNYFDPEIFKLDYTNIRSDESPAISRRYTVGYTFGIDIDREHGMDIHDPDVKKAVEDIAQYFSDRLREYLPNSVYCLYSGGGIYIMVHHKVFSQYYERFLSNPDPDLSWDKMLGVLSDAFDYLIEDMRDEFFKLHPEHVGKVKPDQLNNSQRIFKTIFSVHKSLDYAVIPLDPENIYIDFKKATIPLKPEVIEAGKRWYTDYDDGGNFLNEMLKPFLEKAYNKKEASCKYKSDFKVSSIPVDDIEKWSPCMRNLYNLPTCGEGATRALAAFASFLGQIGIEENQARVMFDELADRWGARKENIFDNYFRKMKVPTCRRLVSDDNRGFPKGVSIKQLGVCKPDMRCLNSPSPYYYVDRKALLKWSTTPHKKTVDKTKKLGASKGSEEEAASVLKGEGF